MKRKGLEMNKRVFGISAVLTLLVTLTAAVHAQSQRSRITIPFTFVVAQKVLPAGDYTFEPNSKDNFHVWLLAGEKGNDAVLFPTVPLRASQTQEETKLVFSKYNDQYFLSEIWTAGEQSGYKLRLSKEEQQLAKNGTHREEVVVTLAGN
jgi:hypothetical protein